MKKINWLAFPSLLVSVYFVYLGIQNFTGNPIFFTVWLILTGFTLYRSFMFLIGNPVNQKPPVNYEQPSDSAMRLQELENLYHQGLITREEFENKRQEILDEL